MPSYTALRRWLVFVALLRLLSGDSMLQLPLGCCSIDPVLLERPCLSTHPATYFCCSCCLPPGVASAMPGTPNAANLMRWSPCRSVPRSLPIQVLPVQPLRPAPRPRCAGCPTSVVHIMRVRVPERQLHTHGYCMHCMPHACLTGRSGRQGNAEAMAACARAQ